MLLGLQLMVCFTHISCKNRNREKLKPQFSVKNRPKPNRKWNSRTVTALLPIQLFINLESFITLSTELENYVAISHGNLAVEMLANIVSTVQDSANSI